MHAFIAHRDFPAATAACTALIAAEPASADAANMMAYLLMHAGDIPGAIAESRRAITLSPNSASLFVNLARNLTSTPDLEGTLAAADRAAELKPDWAEPLITAAEACSKHGYFLAAAERCTTALARFPNDAELRWTLANALHYAGRNGEALEALGPALARAPTDLRLLSSAALFTNYIAGLTPADILEAHRRYGRTLLRHHASPKPAPFPPRAPGRLRIGLISPDLREHSVAYFIRAFLEHYDRERFEVFAYSTSPNNDATTARFRALTDHWRTLSLKNPDEAARALRADDLDVLIDLAGHTKGSALLTLSRGVARHVITYLGYPATTGLPAITTRIVDSLTDPPGAEAFTTERLLRLDPCFLCFTPDDRAPDPQPPHPRPADAPITFGSFNTLRKINPTTIALWAGALQRVPHSRLLLKSRGLEEPAMRASLTHQFAAHAITPDRLDLIPQIPDAAGHLAAYHRIDIALDPYPYHGTTTTCEALWMGVPVVTLAGDRHASRVGVSLLTNVGLAELITHSPEEFADTAAKLAADVERRASLRTNLRGMLRESALYDGAGFAQRLGAALVVNAQTYTRGGHAYSP